MIKLRKVAVKQVHHIAVNHAGPLKSVTSVASQGIPERFVEDSHVILSQYRACTFCGC